MLDKFDILLCLLAGLAVLVIGFVLDMELSAILIRLLITLIVFYIIGAIIKAYLRKTVFFEEPEPDFESDDENENENENEQIHHDGNAGTPESGETDADGQAQDLADDEADYPKPDETAAWLKTQIAEDENI